MKSLIMPWYWSINSSNPKMPSFSSRELTLLPPKAKCKRSLRQSSISQTYFMMTTRGRKRSRAKVKAKEMVLQLTLKSG